MAGTITRRTFGGVVLAAGALLVSACGSNDAGASSAGGLETTTVSIGLGLDPGLAPQMVAIDKGFLKDEGFTDIKTSTYEAGALAGQALAANEIDLWGPGNPPPINMRHNGVPIVVVGTAASGWSEKLVVRDDATLEKPEDLAKLKIGSLTGATSNFISSLESLNGLAPNSIQAVNLTPPEQMVALANNEVQGIVIWNPWPAQFKLDHPDVPVSYAWEQNTSHFPWAQDQPMKASHSRMLFVLREDYLKDKPNAAAALMRAMYKAQAWLRDPANTDEAKSIFVKYTKYDPKVVDAIWSDYVFSPALDDAYVEDMKALTDALAKSGAIKDPQDPLTYTDTQLLQAYDPTMVSVKGGWTP